MQTISRLAGRASARIDVAPTIPVDAVVTIAGLRVPPASPRGRIVARTLVLIALGLLLLNVCWLARAAGRVEATTVNDLAADILPALLGIAALLVAVGGMAILFSWMRRRAARDPSSLHPDIRREVGLDRTRSRE